MNKNVFLIVFSVLFSAGLYAQNLPVDPEIKIGKLPNGVKYYIKANKKPEHRGELRLVVNAGSVLENDDQRGLAHFVEHMAFNGTTHFAKNDLINFLESVGVKFGAEINAYTSFDETVYMLEVPTDNKDLLAKSFLVLEDWAHGISFDSVEIDRERGVISEEWRLGRGASMRILDKQFPVLFKDSKYASRIVIGDINIINNFKHETLRQFYRDWYRPDLMAVVAIGDFNIDTVMDFINEHFSSIPNIKNQREREFFPVPGHDETLFTLVSDKEATGSSIALYNKIPKRKILTTEDYKIQVVESLFQQMLNARLAELAQLSDPPFVYGNVGKGRFVRTSDVIILNARVKDNEMGKGLRTILTEAERVREHGFTASELERAKIGMLRNIEKQAAEKNKTESAVFAGSCVANFLNDSPLFSIEQLLEIMKTFLPSITLEHVNKLAADYMKNKNRVVTGSAPEQPGITLPTENELIKILQEVTTLKTDAYIDRVIDEPLVTDLPAPASIISTNKWSDLGITQWTLSNGAKVIVKATDFKNDEIIIRANSFGGSSLYDIDDFISVTLATNILGESGLGKFPKIELRKKLTGKIAAISPFISTYTEGFQGSCSPKDVETAMQLLYLTFTSPRFDSTSLQSFTARMKPLIINRSNDPSSAFNDTLNVTLSNYHPRSIPITAESLDKANLTVMNRIYKDRFADASDFNFYFVGNIDTNYLKTLACQYIGTLPAPRRNEKWRDIGMNPPKGVIEKVVYKGQEPKSSVAYVFTGHYAFNRKNEYLIESLTDVLDIKLREVIREEKGGTYGVSVRQNFMRLPDERYNLIITFGCSPDRVNELTAAMTVVLDSIKKFGADTLTLNKVKEIQKRAREVNLKANPFWAGIISNYFLFGNDIEESSQYSKLVDNLTCEEIRDCADSCIDFKNYVRVVLLPELKK